jgi:putative transcriptional regulator
MHERESLLLQVLDVMERENFEISEMCTSSKGICFDIFARRNVLLLLLKVLTNIDSISEGHAREIASIGNMLCASPLIVGEKTRNFEMEDGVVYGRHNIPAVTVDTFEDIMLEGTLPMIFASRGGYYVKVDRSLLREARRKKEISLGDVADNIGVSRRSVHKYENEDTCMTLKTALRLEEFLDESLARPINLFFIPKAGEFTGELQCEFERNTLKTLMELGFEVYPVKKAPFNALAKEESDVMITKLTKTSAEGVSNSARIIKSISDTAKTEAFFVMESHTKFRENIHGIPAIKEEELARIDDSDELMDVIKSRKLRAI